MAKSKWEDIKDKLILVEGWARDGLTDKQIADNLGISKDTFYKYKKDHTDFSDSLKKGKELIDYQVENALLKRALGYDYIETTKECKWNKKLEKFEMVVTKTVTKQVAPDTTAQIYWLNNRKPKYWRNRIDNNENNKTDLNNAKEILVKIKEVANNDRNN